MIGIRRKKKKNRVQALSFEEQAKDATEVRPWGFFKNYAHEPEWHLKTLHVKEDAVLSLQSHRKREEHWMVVEGAVIAERWFGDDKREDILKVGDKCIVPVGVKHRISAYKGNAVLVEISLGEFDEDDIKRFSDKYGRA